MSTEPSVVTSVLRIPLRLIDPGPNARGAVGDVDELAASLRAIGQQLPVVVEPAVDGRFRLVDGHRRHAAAKQARTPHLDAIVRPVADDGRRFVAQLAIQANGRRFNPMAEARTLHALMFEHGMTRESIARAVGRSPLWVRDRIGLVHLEPAEVRDVEAGRMTVGEALLRLKSRREMREGRPDTARVARTAAQGRGGKRTPEERALDGVRDAVAAALRIGASARRIDAAVSAGRREVAGE